MCIMNETYSLLMEVGREERQKRYSLLAPLKKVKIDMLNNNDEKSCQFFIFLRQCFTPDGPSRYRLLDILYS